jgi:hypothetical protein
MSPATLECLYAINKYFGRGSVIQRIRQKFAFHLDAKSILCAYANAPPDFTSVEYISKRYAGHNLFHTSETLSLIAIIGDEIENWQRTLDEIVEEITVTCVRVNTFLMGFIGIVFEKYLGLTMEKLDATTMTITDDLSIDDVRLPFFCLPPRSDVPEAGAS